MKLIPLFGINGVGKFAQVDDEDYDLLIKKRWYGIYRKVSCNYYVECNWNLGGGKTTSKKMHTLIMGKKYGFVIDHIDGDGLNNQRSNLRHCTSAENSQNKKKYKNGSSEYKGVTLFKGRKETHKSKWVARIQLNKKSILLGNFPYTEQGKIDAAIAYNNAAASHFGEFAKLNNINKPQTKTIPPPNRQQKIKFPNVYNGVLPPNSEAIELTQGKFAIVSKEDYEWLNQWKWCAKQGDPLDYFSAIRHSHRVEGEKRKTIYMHTFIMNTPKDMRTDHINRNPLDNRRENLRICTPAQNSSNTRVRLNKTSSKYFGVFIHDNRFISRITTNGRKINLGRFPLTKEGEIQAALAYNEAAIKYKGEFAHINIIDQ